MTNKNYVMLCINYKQDGDKLYVRRILLEYTDFDSYGIFHGTRFIDSDPYFKNENSSHQYKFEDDGYTLIESSDPLLYTVAGIQNRKREYHYRYEIDEKTLPVIFTAANDTIAKYTFNERKELR